MKVSKILPPTPIMLISLSYVSYIFSDLQPYPFIYQPHPHSPLPNNSDCQILHHSLQLSMHLRVRNIGLLSLLLVVLVLFYFFYLNQTFFFLKIYQNLISEYLKILFLKCSAYEGYIKSEYINFFFTAVFFSFLFLFLFIYCSFD